MEFYSLELENWGPFEGVHKIELRTTAAPIITFHGENGRGKTTIMRAFYWALYGRVLGKNDQYLKDSQLVTEHHHELSDGVDFGVRLHFGHENSKFELERRARAVESDGHISVSEQTVIFRPDGGVPFPDSKVKERINEVLDENIAEFYLFDGEKLEKVDFKLSSVGEESKQFVKRSVERALGLTFLEKLQRDLETVQERYAKEISRGEKLERETQSLVDGLAALQSDLDSQIRDRDFVKKSLDETEIELNNLQARLKSFDAVRDYAVERTLRLKDLPSISSELETAEQKFRELAENKWLYSLASGLELELQELEQTIDESRTKGAELDVLRNEIRILEDSNSAHKCRVCGNELDKETQEKHQKRIAELSKKLEATEVADVVLAEQSARTIRGLRNSWDNCDALIDLETRIMDARAKLDEERTAIRDLDEKIGLVDSPNILAIEDNVQDCKSKIQRFRDTLVLLDEKILSIRSKIDTNNRKISQSPSFSDFDRNKLKILDELVVSLNSAMVEFRNRMREQLQQASSEILRKLSSEQEFSAVDITDQYQISMLSADGRTYSQPSAGYTQILAMSFIAGLAEVSGSKNAVAMDTPWGRLDRANRKLVLDWIAGREPQTILFVQSGELTIDQARETFKGRLGRQYEIQRISANRSKIVGI